MMETSIVIRKDGVNAHFPTPVFSVCKYENLEVIDKFNSENEAINFCLSLGYNRNQISRYY